MNQFRGCGHQGGEAMADQLKIQRMKSVKRRSHAGQDNTVELSFREAVRQILQRLRAIETLQRRLQSPWLIENVFQVLAFDDQEIRDGKIRIHLELPS